MADANSNGAPSEAIGKLADHSQSLSPELAAARKWFSGNSFNLAVDYWGTDWIESVPYGSGYTREVYLPILRELKLGFIQIYGKGELGHSSFRSATHSEHPRLGKVVIGEQADLTPAAVAKAEGFVRRGGKLISTVASGHSPEMAKLLGIKVVQRGAADEAHAILRGGGSAGVFAPWDKLELVEAEQLYPAYLSSEHAALKAQPVNWSQAGLLDELNPEKAGFPAATVRKLGKGAAVHIPTSIFEVYWKYGYLDISAWLKEIIQAFQPSPFFRTDAYSYVEVVLGQKHGALLVHFINGNPGHDMSYVKTEDLFVDEIPSLGPITNWIRCAEQPRGLLGNQVASPRKPRGKTEF